MDYTVHAILQARILEWVAIPFSRGSSQPRDQTQISCIVGGKSMNTGVGSLSLPQWIFPTQESNRGLLHCRRILYQLSYQGSPVHGVSTYYLVPPASVSSPVTSLYNRLTGSHESKRHMAHGKCSLSGCSYQEMVCKTIPATFPTQLCSLPPTWIRCSPDSTFGVWIKVYTGQ